MADSDAAHAPTMAVLYPWREQARAAVFAAGADEAAAIETLQLLVWRLRGDGFAAHELLALHDLVRLGKATMPIDWPDGGSPGQTVADRLAELAEAVDGPLPRIMVTGTPGRPPRAPAPTCCSPPTRTPRSGLLVYAAEAAAAAVGRLREVTSPRHGSATRRLGELLERCDRRPHARAGRRPHGADRAGAADRQARRDGVPSREIADQLYLSTRTVENHLQRVYTKLGVTGRTGAGRRPAARCPTLRL